MGIEQPGGARRRGRVGRGLTALAAAVAGVLSLSPPASATVGCSFAAGHITIVISNGGSTNAFIEHRLSDNVILVNNAACGGATALTTNSINIAESGMNVNSAVDIYFTAGQFEPGTPDEGDGSSEIEFNLDYGASGTDDVLRVYGSNAPEDWAVGAGGINPNYVFDLPGTPDSDINYLTGGEAGIETKELAPGEGADQVLADGGNGTGAEAATELRMFAGPGNDHLRGGSESDSLEGGDDTDTLVGRGDSDSFLGGPGNDIFDGVSDAGTGTDTANYQDATGPVTVNLALPDGPQNTGGGGTDTFNGNILHLGGSPHADVLTGDSGVNAIFGQDGADVLDGGANDDFVNGVGGPDIVRGGFGNDQLAGGDANSGTADPGDTVAYDNVAGTTTGITLNGLSNDTALVVFDGEQGMDLLRQFSNVIGTSFADSVTGNGFANTLTGGGGADLLMGAGGSDNLNGGDGSDNLVGGDGDDLFGGGADADAILGAAGADSGSGDAGADSIDGGDGNDNLAGGSEDDSLTGAAGADALDGDGGNDSVDGGSENDTLRGGTENDSISGGAGNDKLFGDAGRDTLLGLDGIDKLFAKDKTRDARIHCGPGSNKKESAKFDKKGKPKKRDPRPRSC